MSEALDSEEAKKEYVSLADCNSRDQTLTLVFSSVIVAMACAFFLCLLQNLAWWRVTRQKQGTCIRTLILISIALVSFIDLSELLFLIISRHLFRLILLQVVTTACFSFVGSMMPLSLIFVLTLSGQYLVHASTDVILRYVKQKTSETEGSKTLSISLRCSSLFHCLYLFMLVAGLIETVTIGMT